jgi:hypothetical protein
MKPTHYRRVFIKMVAAFCSPCTAKDAAVVMRTAIEPLVGVGLDFDEADDRELFNTADPGPAEWAKRPVFLSGPTTAYAVLVDHYWRPEAAYHYLVVSPDQSFPEVELAREWKSMTRCWELIVDSLAPHFAFGWGKLGDAGVSPIDFESLCSASVPSKILPWTFLGKEWLRGTIRDEVVGLPAQQSRPLKNGWLIQSVGVPGTPPPERFVQALRSIGGIEYRDPLL